MYTNGFKGCNLWNCCSFEGIKTPYLPMGHTSHSDVFVSDPLFSDEEIFLCDLLVYVDETNVTAAVFHSAEKKFIALSDNTFPDHAEAAVSFMDIVSQSPLLSKKGYRKTVFTSGFRLSTLVPNPLYSPGSAELHLNFSNSVPAEYAVLTDEISKIDARNIHAFPDRLYKSISSSFPGANIVHLSSVNKNIPRELMIADVHSNFLNITVVSGQSLLLHNSYDYENPEGLVYFILFACEQLQINPESIRLRFSGKVSEDDPAMRLAHKYIRDTAIIDRPDIFSYSNELDVLQQHHYFTVYVQALCVS
jgi:Protein of unknown function (DUF3822)